MKLRPTIFLSGVSSEFGSFRDAAEIEIQKKDCFPINQPSFGVDYREIEEILRTKISEADAVIHLVGFRFGAEPKNRSPGKSRRSYTQMEHDVARELGKPVYVFLSADASVRDLDEPIEDTEATELQLAHRESLQKSNNIRYTFRNKNELGNLVAGIPLLATADFRVDISRIDRYAPAELIGREDELSLLDNTWLKVRWAESGRPYILTVVALGGEGKTSLVAKWLANLAYRNWPGCDSAFAWSFYSQGTRDQSAASSDLFLKEAITFFGNDDDKKFAASNAGAYEKGQHLARIVGRRRALLILDGLEPLQYAPTAPTPGELKDSGIIGLLRGVANNNSGLCIVTTRYSLPNLNNFFQTTAPELKLLRLSSTAGIDLLKKLGVHGKTVEFEELVGDVKGHALTLNVLGTYLRDAHGGDIRKYSLVKFEEADHDNHAFHVMDAYVRWLSPKGLRVWLRRLFSKDERRIHREGKVELALLQLMGLFDRPVTSDCFEALIKSPAIPRLTEPLVRLNQRQLNISLKRLEDARLLTINRDASAALISLDAHPLLREYFATRLQEGESDAWRRAHRRLYQHLYSTTPDKEKPTLEDLQPLYHAVAHGCNAGLYKETLDRLCEPRIWRRKQMYTVKKLGAYGSDLGAIACFFDEPWSRLSSELPKDAQAFLLNATAYCLRALGRLIEAVEPMRSSAVLDANDERWLGAAIGYSNLSQLELVLGEIAEAVRDAERSVTYADLDGALFERTVTHCSYGDALIKRG
jgi:hypothetical protein